MNLEDIQSIEDLAVVSEEVVWQNFFRFCSVSPLSEFRLCGFTVEIANTNSKKEKPCCIQHYTDEEVIHGI